MGLDRIIEERKGWRQALETYGRPKVLVLLLLGFAAGLPFLLVFSTMSAWLHDAGVSRSEIGFFGWIGMTYSIKVVWSPIVDRLSFPLLTARFGRRRGWMLAAQLGIVGSLVGMALVGPEGHLALFAFLAVLVAFASATQDIALDAFRIECAADNEQGALAAAYQLGYRIALLVAGAGALFIADSSGWIAAYLAMAVCMSVGLITLLAVREPDARSAYRSSHERTWERAVLARAGLSAGPMQTAGLWFLAAVVEPFADFFRRHGVAALVILLFIGVFRLSDLVMGIMANPFYLELGFTKTEIAEIAKIYGFFMVIAGAALGGLAVARFGVFWPLFPGAVAVAASNLLFAFLATQGPAVGWLTITISAENLASGFAGTALIAYLSSLTSTAYTATQYALFSSFMTLPGKFVSGFSGVLVDRVGYAEFFVYSAVLGLPAILLSCALIGFRPHFEGKEIVRSDR
ncbi:MAG: MFS transporter [Rhodospirillales bacterium]|nr:MFS transporter [Rhodospirillales bacterium]